MTQQAQSKNDEWSRGKTVKMELFASASMFSCFLLYILLLVLYKQNIPKHDFIESTIAYRNSFGKKSVYVW